MPGKQAPQKRPRYSVDESNRLVIIDPKHPLNPKRVLEGRFSINGRNKLAYVVSKNSQPQGSAAHEESIALNGAWKLTRNHELALTINQSKQGRADTLTLKGSLVQAEANGLVFALKQDRRERTAAQRLTLSGRWQADAQNRINFLVEKSQGSEDRLTFQGGWEVGAQHELLYRYRQRMRHRLTEERALIFDGSWEIANRNRLAYRLLGTDTSVFEFRASLQSPSIRAAQGRIVYQAGIGVSQGRQLKRRIALFGSWKVNRDLSVAFEIPYSEGRIGAIRFESAVKLNQRDSITLELANERGESAAISVIFTRKLSRDVSAFLRLKEASQETAVLGGIQVRF